MPQTDRMLDRRGLLAAVLAVAALVPAVPAAAVPAAALPLGDADLPETRSVSQLAPGVTLTHIVRGDTPAPADQIGTTTRGPWDINILTVDPRRSAHRLTATYGPDLAGVETTTDLVRTEGALAGVNASFFTFTADPAYPGDPVGLGLYDGDLLSEPSATEPAEVDMVVDPRRGTVLMGRLAWSGSVQNVRTRRTVTLDHLNHPPVVPSACADLADQTHCAVPGDVVRFTPSFAASTPAGPGAEVVLDSHDCVIRTSATRGTSLARGQWSVQATGSDTVPLLAAAHGCLHYRSTLTDDSGHRVDVHPGLTGVNGRYRLVADGRVVVPAGSDSFFARNPRTIAGTTASGALVLATIDGRMTTSVGTTLDETAAVAHALGLTDALNLDGGGSTTMSVNGALTNHPSGGAERPVGDALVLVR